MGFLQHYSVPASSALAPNFHLILNMLNNIKIRRIP